MHALNTLLVGSGGALGCIVRYFSNELLLRVSTSLRFPFTTFVINVTGCFLIGCAVGYQKGTLSPEARLLLITGFLGGFTTFSTFGLETFSLLKQDEIAKVLINVLGQVVLGVLAVWGGLKVSELI